MPHSAGPDRTTPTAGAAASVGLAALSPANFGMVMATGIVSIAAQRFALPRVALALLAVSALAYAALWVLTLLRALRHRAALVDDLTDHRRAPGFFTTIAATGVLGAQCLLVAGSPRCAAVLWALTIVLWALGTYTIFAGLTVKAHKPALEKGIDGGWLLAVVATQSIAVLSALLAPQAAPAQREVLLFFALSMWAWGGMLYIWLMTLIFYRYAFFTLAPDDLTPPYWINMGAMAISTLAGALLVAAAAPGTLLASLLPFLKGLTILFWATGTWWIPLLLVLGVWRYVLQRYPLRYEPAYWAVVFPLGMYATATDEMAEVLQLPFLMPLAPLFLALALGAWCVIFTGLAAQVLRQWRPAHRP